MSFKQLIFLLVALLGCAAAVSAASPVDGASKDEQSSTGITTQPSTPASVAGEGTPAELQDFLNGLLSRQATEGLRMHSTRMNKRADVPEPVQVSLHRLACAK
jgi:hypothetical protein